MFRKALYHEAHTLRLMSPVIAHVTIPERFPKRQSIKYLEHDRKGHAEHALLKYTPTGDMKKTPTRISRAELFLSRQRVESGRSRKRLF